MKNNIFYKFKILIVGDSYVGKSTMMLCYKNKEFINTYQITIGVDFISKTIILDNKSIKLEIWDTAGSETYRSLVKSYYRNSQIILYVYDTTNLNSFINLTHWLEESNMYLDCKNFNKILIGNKIDLIEGKQVDNEIAKIFAKDNDMYFTEVSCKNAISIDKMFNFIIKETLDKVENEDLIINDLQLFKKLDISSKKKQSSHCC